MVRILTWLSHSRRSHCGKKRSGTCIAPNMAEPTDRAREEFLSEVQEIIETFSNNLLSLDGALKSGKTTAPLVNEAFRAVHTLKGLSGLFGAAKLGELSHHLEDLLDALRLGRMPLDPNVLDLLFNSVEVYGRLLKKETTPSALEETGLESFLSKLQALGGAKVEEPSPIGGYDLDPGLLAVLTEYEEHRLRANIEEQKRLYRLRAKLDLLTIDTELEQIKEGAKNQGEIITYLPTGAATSGNSIELDILMASDVDLAVLSEALGRDNISIEEIARSGEETHKTEAPPQNTDEEPEDAPLVAGVSNNLAPAHESQAPARNAASLRSLTQTVRVDIRKLDRLMNIVGELAIVRGALSRMAERLLAEGQRYASMEVLRLHRSFDRRLTEMQDGILEVRMVPLGQVFDRLARVVRQVSRSMGKETRLVITGAETEIDKLIVEELSDPLMHMIRNAIDHGVEARDVRQRVGKPEIGTIALNAFQKGNHVMIEIEDDGRGIDESKLLERAIAMGKVSADEASELSREEVLGLIFLPGLSTRAEVGDVSGRGVGMDVVKTNIAKLGGVIDVQSESGIGTKMVITLPITLAIVSALMVECSAQTFAIPLSSVSEALSFEGGGVRKLDGREVMTLRGTTLPLCRLEQLLGLKPNVQRQGRRFVVVASLGHRRLGLVVDDLYGQQDIVIKALGNSLSSVRGFSGATELGDQRVGLVLDAAALIEEVLSGSEPGRDRTLQLHG